MDCPVCEDETYTEVRANLFRSNGCGYAVCSSPKCDWQQRVGTYTPDADGEKACAYYWKNGTLPVSAAVQ